MYGNESEQYIFTYEEIYRTTNKTENLGASEL